MLKPWKPPRASPDELACARPANPLELRPLAMNATPIAVYLEGLKAPSGTEPLSEIIETIRTSPELEKAIGEIRAEPDKDRRAELKKKLPAMQCSATRANGGRDVVKHSGLVQLDFDHIGGDAAAKLRDTLEYDPHTAAAFISPSGDGLKALLAIPADLDGHEKAYEAAMAYARDQWKVEPDTSCRDPKRLCFLSHDREAWDKPAEPLDVDKHAPAPEEPPAAPPPQAKNTPAPAAPQGWVILPSGKCGNYESAKTAFGAMRKTGRFFLRGGGVCEVTKLDGIEQIQLVKPAGLSSSIETCGVPVAVYRQLEDGKYALLPGARASHQTAAMWIESAARCDLPSIRSVVKCPPLTWQGGGVVLLPRGFHEPTGTLVLGANAAEEMDHRAALDAIDVILRDFDFVTPSDKARALAMLITPSLVAGGLLRDHVPMFAVEADQSQSGKGYYCELVQTVYGECPSVIGRREGGVGSLDESLAAALVGGRPFIQFDNLRNKLASQFFEMVLTCPRGATVGCRTPHRPEVQIDPSRVIFHATSNGLEMTPDLANRACVIRIRKREGWNPPHYPEGGLVEHVAANRSRFLGAVYDIATRWARKGRPRTGDTRAPGRFRAWGQSLDWIVQELCGAPPLLDGHEQVQLRVSNPGLVWLREIGVRIVSEHADRAEPWTASNLGELAEDCETPIPGIKPGDPEDKAARAVGVIMARLFGNRREVHADDLLVTRQEVTKPREDGNGVRLVKTYRFERVSPSTPTTPARGVDNL
jgi:hypothetical protein